MKQSFSHDLDLTLARRATEKALQSYVERFAEYRPRLDWLDDRNAEVQFEALGMTLRGLFELSEGAIHMEMKVPLVLRAFRKRALEVVESEIRAWIDRARRGEIPGDDD